MFEKDKKLNFNSNSHSPHMIVSNLISGKTFILDVGCNTGYIGNISLIIRGAL